MPKLGDSVRAKGKVGRCGTVVGLSLSIDGVTRVHVHLIKSDTFNYYTLDVFNKIFRVM